MSWINMKCDGSIETSEGTIPNTLRRAADTYADHMKALEPVSTSMILYNPKLDFHGWNKEEGKTTDCPLVNVMGETRSALLEPQMGCSLIFNNREDFLQFAKEINRMASEFNRGILPSSEKQG